MAEYNILKSIPKIWLSILEKDASCIGIVNIQRNKIQQVTKYFDTTVSMSNKTLINIINGQSINKLNQLVLMYGIE